MANESVETLPLVPSKDLESSMKDLASLGNKEYQHPVSEYQYLCEVWEELKVSNEKESICEKVACSLLSLDKCCCRNERQSIRKARKIGQRIIMMHVFRNLFHKAVYREICVYLGLIVNIVLIVVSAILLGHEVQSDEENIKKTLQ